MFNKLRILRFDTSDLHPNPTRKTIASASWRSSSSSQLFILFAIVGATMSLDDAWNLADALNGFMAIPNLIAVLTLSPVIIKLVREYFSENKL